MSELEYAGLNTTLRLYEASMLSQSDYDTLLQMESVDRLLDYLAKTDYVVDDSIKRTREFEPIMQQRLNKGYQDLLEATPDPRVIEIFSLRYTYHNLKLLIKQKYVERDLSNLLIPIGSYSIDTLKQVVETKGQNQDLHPVLQDAVYEAITSVEDTGDTFSIDIILDTAYLKHIGMNAEEIGSPEVKVFTQMKIDFQNLITFVRAFNQGQSNAFIFAALSDSGAVSRNDIIQNWRDQDLNGLVDSYHRADYMINLDPIWDQLQNKKVNPTEIDAIIQGEFSEILRSYSFEAFGPMPVLTYLHFFENEIDNVRLILIGKENQLGNEIIKERMRPIHGL